MFVKKTNFLFFISVIILIAFFSCNGNSPVNQPISDSADSTVTAEDEIPKPNREMFRIDTVMSNITCTRSKTVKDVEQEVVILGKAMSVKVGQASFSASIDIKLKKGNWCFVNHKLEEGIIVLNMNSVSTIQVGKNKSLEMASPEYLDVKKYPTATLYILKFDSIPGNKREMNISARIQLKDSTAEITFPGEVQFTKYGENNCPSIFTGKFHIDGKAWGLNKKNANVVKDDLFFEVVLVTGETK